MKIITESCTGMVKLSKLNYGDVVGLTKPSYVHKVFMYIKTSQKSVSITKNQNPTNYYPSKNANTHKLLNLEDGMIICVPIGTEVIHHKDAELHVEAKK